MTHQVLFAAEEQVEIKESLLNLLHLIIENIGQLSIDDQVNFSSPPKNPSAFRPGINEMVSRILSSGKLSGDFFWRQATLTGGSWPGRGNAGIKLLAENRSLRNVS